MAKKKTRRADERLLLALACGATVESAARQAGLGESTVDRRLADPAFQARLRELRTYMVQRSAGTLTAAATEAVKTLLDLQKPATPAAVRLTPSKPTGWPARRHAYACGCRTTSAWRWPSAT